MYQFKSKMQKMSSRECNVLLGCTGSVASIKVPQIVQELTAFEHLVCIDVVLCKFTRLLMYDRTSHPVCSHSVPIGVILNTAKDRKGPQRIVVELQRTSRKTGAQDHKGPQGHLIHHCCITSVIARRRAVVYVNDYRYVPVSE